MKHKGYEVFPIGTVCIEEEDGAVTALYLVSEAEEIQEKTPLLIKAFDELKEYFEGKRTSFDLPLRLTGTEFQMKVWEALKTIPYGETRSYGDIAKQIGNPKASRAVGGANNKNPIMIIVPCHRVIGANGALVGFGGGLDVKQELLNLEKKV